MLYLTGLVFCELVTTVHMGTSGDGTGPTPTIRADRSVGGRVTTFLGSNNRVRRVTGNIDNRAFNPSGRVALNGGWNLLRLIRGHFRLQDT